MRCRRWRCPRCGPALRNRLVHLVSQAPPTALLTLTVDVNRYPDPYSAARRMSWAFPRLVRDLRKWSGPAPVEYLAVWERTQRGWPHLHVLIRGPFIPQRLISTWWNSLTGSPIVDIRAVHGARAGGRYVTKYLLKDPDPFAQGRSIRASAKFLPEPMRPQAQRACTFGKVRVYEGRVWNWLMDELSTMRFVDLDDHGQALSLPVRPLNGSESLALYHWGRQRERVRRLERPPPIPGVFADLKPWTEKPRQPAPDGADAVPAR